MRISVKIRPMSQELSKNGKLAQKERRPMSKETSGPLSQDKRWTWKTGQIAMWWMLLTSSTTCIKWEWIKNIQRRTCEESINLWNNICFHWQFRKGGCEPYTRRFPFVTVLISEWMVSTKYQVIYVDYIKHNINWYSKWSYYG